MHSVKLLNSLHVFLLLVHWLVLLKNCEIRSRLVLIRTGIANRTAVIPIGALVL